ncbi:MAG: riboflavin synthase [Lentisphaerae bacterium]|nr:riboflavin synthase [Lentisphaerota bacterium]
MFTGLVERVGRVARLDARGGGARLVIEHDPWPEPLAPGESVSVQGICLTVAERGSGHFQCDVLNETLTRTTLGDQRPGALLNLERALRADGRFGGHLVTGHVDGTGVVTRLESTGSDWLLETDAGTELCGGMVMKGSIAIDGISLTVAALTATRFQVHLIPFTWAHTSIRDARVGDRVNLETDMIGKYVAKSLARQAPAARAGVTLDDLERAGFA